MGACGGCGLRNQERRGSRKVRCCPQRGVEPAKPVPCESRKM